MLQTIVHTLVATTGLLSATFAPADLPVTPIQVNEEHIHVVKKGETLSLISEKYYDNIDSWTSILKDNPQVMNPNQVEEGTVLKIRYIPLLVEESEFAMAKAVETPMVDSIALEATNAAITAVEPTTAPTAPQSTYVGGPLTEEQLTYLGNCEAGMNPTRNSGNGYYGAFQFSYGTWKSMNTGYERADLAPIEVQKNAVQRLLSRSSIFTQFPGCARKMQANGII